MLLESENIVNDIASSRNLEILLVYIIGLFLFYIRNKR